MLTVRFVKTGQLQLVKSTDRQRAHHHPSKTEADDQAWSLAGITAPQFNSFPDLKPAKAKH